MNTLLAYAYYVIFNILYKQKKYQLYKMGEVKQIDIKNRIYYFYNDIIDIKNVDPILLKIDKKSYKNIGIYNIGYIIQLKKLMIVKTFTV